MEEHFRYSRERCVCVCACVCVCVCERERERERERSGISTAEVSLHITLVKLFFIRI